MPVVLLVGIGGFAGTVARWLVDSWVSRQGWTATFPLGTLLVNVSGSFALGLLFALAIDRGILPAGIRAPLMIGFLGAYTTFSTLMIESWRLMEHGSMGLGLVNLVGSAVLGMAAVGAGLALGRALG
jgi:fluoride exporter